MEDKILNRLSTSVKNAERRMVEELQRRWPVDAVIGVKLNRKQIKPTMMKVIGHNGKGFVRCSMDSHKSRLGKFVKDIHYADIHC